ncbi:surfactant-associated protein 2 [Mus caroli]|uniref:Surfactant-associated protein 2 n=1 Tax=Mus caroli TaxID=10089 RepID=A0A6P5R8B2_MUSCR|nr:surfactant-associated protein 2 [Mus caroli]
MVPPTLVLRTQGKEIPFPHLFWHWRRGVATMESLMRLFLLLALLSSSQAGPKVTLQVKLTEAFQAKTSQISSALDMLQKICLLLHLPSGTNVTLLHKGPPHFLTCRA